MKSSCLLLSLEGFCEGAAGERLFREALGKIDAERRERVERMRSGKGRLSCVGAGLLLQLALQKGIGNGPEDGPAVYSASEILGLLDCPVECAVKYGEKGKPYLKDDAFFFNLSHSGEYAACAVSDREIGVDIQQCVPAAAERLAERFFSETERRALETCGTKEERQALFFRLWARKEAYGKLLGEGVFRAIAVSLLPGVEHVPEKLVWREWQRPEGYRIALCQYAEKS